MKKIAVASLVFAAAVPIVWLARGPDFPTSNQVQADYLKSDVLLYSREGEVIHELRTDPHGRRLEWVSLERISPALREAAVFAEDRDFRRHGGVDWSALAAAAAGAALQGGARGASTISMQTAALLKPDLQPRKLRRSIWQKLRQIRAAWALESQWSKEEILEAYLNLVSFRGELQGVSAASRGLFGKQPHGLDAAESAVLAALIRAPNADSDRVLQRAAQLAEAMRLTLNDTALDEAVDRISKPGYRIEQRARLAPHLMRRMLSRGSHGQTRPLSSAVSADLQRFALNALRQRLLPAQAQNVHDGAVLVADNRTGEVLAYIGNGGDVTSARHVDGIQAFRQAGSTLKPFLYALAFERRILTPASLIEDNPLNLTVLGGIYRPSNYDNRFRGPVSARTALASSLNIPAVRTLNLVGVEDFVNRLEKLGFRDLRSPEHYGPSLALGSADVSLWDLVNAFRSLANQGKWSPLRLTLHARPSEPKQVFSPEAAFLVARILSDRESRSLTFGLESPLSTRFWSAAKTGTSKDMRDNWCVGWSERYTVGVWVGNFSGEPMWNVSGITGAAPVWRAVMDWLHRDLASHPPAPPPQASARPVDFVAGGETRVEWFVKGTETQRVKLAEHPAGYKIVSPSSGAVIALDPDIPSDRQRMFFEAAPPSDALKWTLNGRAMGPAGSLTPWRPEPGEHLLKLLDSTGQVLDQVQFTVRGGSPSVDEAEARATQSAQDRPSRQPAGASDEPRSPHPGAAATN